MNSLPERERRDLPGPNRPGPDLPGNVHATIGRRVELLGDDTRRILAAASVLGRRFDVATLAAITHLDQPTVSAALADAITADVVLDEGEGRYAFAHALVEDTLYESLTEARRARLHRAAAEAFESLAPADPPLAVIADHYGRALPSGNRLVAVDYARRAGAEAAARGACEQAVQHYERALDAATIDDASVLQPEQMTELLCDLGDAYDMAGLGERAQQTYAEAVELSRPNNDPVGLAHALLGLVGGADEPVGFNLAGADRTAIDMLDEVREDLPPDATTLRALVSARVAGARYDTGDVERAQELSTEALALARASGDAHAIAVALAIRHTALSCPEALTARLELDDELRALDRPHSVQAEVWRVGDLLECGRLADADAAMASLSAGAFARTQPRARWYDALYRALRAQIDGRVEDAASCCSEAHAIGTSVGARSAGVCFAVQSLFVARERRELDGLAEVLDALAADHPDQPGFVTTAAWVRVQTGEIDEARRQFAEIRARGFDNMPRNGVWLANMRLLSEIVFALEDGDAAAQLYELLLPYRDHFVVTSRVLMFLGSVELPLGVFAITSGSLDAAREHLDRARAAHAGLVAPLLTARTDLAFAALHDARSEHEAARSLRARVAVRARAANWLDILGTAEADSGRHA
jgi:tetratricopeptide (TPR) repeat protein